ncbi:MAG: thioredoxin domain-containing protein [bacterium]
MKRPTSLTILLLLLCSFNLSAITLGELEFGEDFDAISAAAQESRQPMLIDFYTDWCFWCKVMDDSTFPDPYVQKFMKNFELGKINAEVDTLVAQRYGVRSYPTFLLIKPDGTEIDRIVGYSTPEEFVGAIVNSLNGVGTLEDLRARQAANPNDYDLMFELAEKYMYRSNYEQARSYYAKLMDNTPADKQNLAATAAYKLAYMKYKEKNFVEAAQAYTRMATDYPAAEEAESARLMVAYCYQKAEDFEQARAEYTQFLKDYPETEEKAWIGEQMEKMK